jgi:hypothetical protein
MGAWVVLKLKGRQPRNHYIQYHKWDGSTINEQPNVEEMQRKDHE